jgi:hypothetical protein
MTKLERLDAAIQKERERAADIAARVRTLEAQKTDEENAQIVQMVRKVRLTPAELERFLERHKNTLTNPTKTPPITAAAFTLKKESEDKPNENN